jgi:hypothetical protein
MNFSFIIVSIVMIVVAYMYKMCPSMPSLSLIKSYAIFGYNVAKFLISKWMRSVKARIVNYISNNTSTLENGNLVLSYVRRGRQYKIVIVKENLTRMPSPVVLAYDEDENDVTELIHQYMGANHDWHMIKYTPHMLGYKSLSFELTTGKTEVFNNNTPIVLGELIM